MKTTKKLLSLSRFSAILLLAVIAISCNPEKKESLGNYEKGIFILNEGGFGHGTAEVSYYNTNTKITQQSIFSATNGRPLGDVGQSMTFYDNKYYIVVNNSNKIEVVDVDFKSVMAFENIIQPRYATFIAGKCYVTSWGNDGEVLVLSPSNGTVLEKVSVGQGAEQMQLVGTKLYVANSGGFGNDSTVSVVNTTTNQVEANIVVGNNPNSIVVDNANNLCVLLGGKYNETWTILLGAGLVKIDSKTNDILLKFEFEDSYSNANSLCTNGDNLYYLFNGGINKIGVNDTQAPTEHFIEGAFYSLFYDSGKLYATDAADYQSNGKVYTFDSNTGAAIDTIPAGIIPRHILFRN